MTDDEPDNPDWGFGDMVTVDIHRGGETFEVEGEVTATGPDNRDLDDDQYIISLGHHAHVEDVLNRQEIIHKNDVKDWRQP